MPNYLIDERDVSMGNEDSWTLVVNDPLTEAHIEHWWSHRDGSPFNFRTGRRTLSLTESRVEYPHLHEKVVAKLKEIRFQGVMLS